MRPAPLLLPILLLGGVLVPVSVADTPARARAVATVATGPAGDVGTVTARGDSEQADEVSAEEPGVVIATATATARASRTGGKAAARAVVTARQVDLLDGLVTATSLRRSATAAGGTVAYAGSVRGLKIGSRRIGDVSGERSYSLDGKGSVAVNRGGAALRVTLGRAAGELPAGTIIRVGVVAADATDRVAPAATPTPTATPKPKPRAKPDPDRAREARAARRREAARRRAARVRARLTRDGYAFPIFGDARAADEFGAGRQIGAHQGNDIFASFGAPVLAVADGVLEKVGTLPISGNRLWLRTKDGDEFFYAHLAAFSPDAVNGRRVEAGTVLGFTGNTGDAEPTPPHVHFEIHPGGAKAIDPHEILAAWQEERDVPTGAWLARYGSDTAERPGALVEVRDFIAAE